TSAPSRRCGRKRETGTSACARGKAPARSTPPWPRTSAAWACKCPSSRSTLDVARFLPNPAGDLLRRVDRSLTNAEDVMERVDSQLTEVNSRLGDVGGTLATAGTTLEDATAVLSEVRSLLAELQSELELLRQVPELAAKLDDV